MSRKVSLCIDLDGTITEDSWPRLGAFMPGAVDALRELTKHAHVWIYSCRLSPLHPSGDKRDAAELRKQVNDVRELLDSVGLYTVEIYERLGKPSAMAYVDNRAVRYAGKPGSWKALTPKLLNMCGAKEAAQELDAVGDVHP